METGTPAAGLRGGWRQLHHHLHRNESSRLK
jgi:hypothetical protein